MATTWPITNSDLLIENGTRATVKCCFSSWNNDLFIWLDSHFFLADKNICDRYRGHRRHRKSCSQERRQRSTRHSFRRSWNPQQSEADLNTEQSPRNSTAERVGNAATSCRHLDTRVTNDDEGNTKPQWIIKKELDSTNAFYQIVVVTLPAFISLFVIRIAASLSKH